MKIGTKLTISIIFLNIILIITIYFVCDYLINQKFEEDYMRSLQHEAVSLEEDVLLLKQKASNSCKWFERSARIISSIQNNDLNSIADLSDTARNAFGLDLFMIINKDGTIFYRSDEPESSGMDLSAKFMPFQVAIEGQVASDIYLINGTPFICATSPVYDGDNNIIATVTTGYDLSMESFVDGYKSITDNEITIFVNDTRAMTTITNESGKRITGTQLSDTKVVDAVLEKHDHYYGKTIINNIRFLCAYIPFEVDQDNMIILFLGKSMETLDTIAQSTSNVLIMTISIIAFIIVIVILIFVHLFIRRPLNKLTSKLYEIKATDSDTCNLTVHIENRSKDEIGAIGRQFNKLLANIRKMVENITEASQTLSIASETLAASSEETAATASEVTTSMNNIFKAASSQASEAGKSVETANILSDNLSEIIESSEHMKSATRETGNVSKMGLESVTLLKKISQENTGFIDQMSEKVISLNEKSEAIGSIVEVITKIASQTNLLSLNASIEAARAGEAGRGFAIVANEVGSLAVQSADSTKNIRNLLTDIQTEIKNTVSLMSIVTSSIKEQNNAVENTGESFHNISDSIDSIIHNIKMVSDSITQMETSKEEIVGAIHSISDTSRSTSDSAELVNHSVNEMSVAVEDIAKLAQNLNEISQNLNVNIANFIL